MKQTTIEALTAELGRARCKFPMNRQLTVALGEEFGELCQAQLQGRPRHQVMVEALQVATVAIRIYEEGDATLEHLSEGEMKP